MNFTIRVYAEFPGEFSFKNQHKTTGRFKIIIRPA